MRVEPLTLEYFAVTRCLLESDSLLVTHSMQVDFVLIPSVVLVVVVVFVIAA